MKIKNNKNGLVNVLWALVFMILITITALALYDFLFLLSQMSTQHIDSLQNYYFAEFGIRRGIWETGASWPHRASDIYIDLDTLGLSWNDDGSGDVHIETQIATQGSVHTITSTANGETITAVYEAPNITSWN